MRGKNDLRLEQNEIELLSNVMAQVNEYVSKAWLELKLEQKEAARQKLMKALIKAQDVERTLLAQELHDGAGQMLTSLLVRMKALERDIEDEKNSSKIEHLCENISELIEYIRQISYQNRPIVLEKMGLKKALENLMEDMVVPSGLHSTISIDIEITDPPKEIETTIYRISQEALTNAIRHANAQTISLKLWSDQSAYNLVISDDGIGFDVDEYFSGDSTRQMGLTTMKERLELLGGDLEIKSISGEGTELIAILPVLEVMVDER